MGLKTPQQYLESLRDGRVVYIYGERVEDVTKHPILRITANRCALGYSLTLDPRYHDLMTTTNEEGELVSRAFVAAKNAQGLLKRREMIQLGCRIGPGKTLPAQFTGIDGLNAITVVCRRMDNVLGANYLGRVESYRKYAQKEDCAVALAMTDVKGDRSLRPSQQKAHKDYYLRIVGERSDGIIVRGAKAHISTGPVVNEIIVLPCRRHHEEDKDYVVAFATPPNAKGITFISSEPETNEPDNLFDHPISATTYLNDALVIFDDVFVPNERIFMKREWPFSGDMAYMFANFHRLSSDANKAMETAVLAGAAALMAEYNGIERSSRIQDYLAWFAMYTEGAEILGRAACENCVTEPDSGLVYPNPMYSNIAKLWCADNFHQAIKYLQDIAGGILATAPSSKDFFNPETRPMIEKYLGARDGIPTEHRLRLLKLIKDFTSTYEDVLTIHAEGSLAMQRLSIYALADFERYKAAAKRAAKISDGTEHPLFTELPDWPPVFSDI